VLLLVNHPDGSDVVRSIEAGASGVVDRQDVEPIW